MANRKERRWQLRMAKMLRIKNMYGRFSEVGTLWYNKTYNEGKQLHAQNVERNEKATYEFLSQKEVAMKEQYESMGYSAAKVELLLEAWRIGAIKSKDLEELKAQLAKAIKPAKAKEAPNVPLPRFTLFKVATISTPVVLVSTAFVKNFKLVTS